MKQKIENRNEKFTLNPETSIWCEIPSEKNPYVSRDALCHGYNLFELIETQKFSDVVYLIFTGELPNEVHSDLFQKLLIAFINPGPRHFAARSAMNAGVGRTKLEHILPVSLMVLGGEHLGGLEVINAMRFLKKNIQKTPAEIESEFLSCTKDFSIEDDVHIIPGFGRRFGSVDELCAKQAEIFCGHPAAGETLDWGSKLCDHICDYNMGWLSTGLVASVLCDLGFPYRFGASLYQFMCSPGLIAHGIEKSDKHITSMPFLDEKNYIIEK